LLVALLASLQSSAKGLAKTNTLAAGATGLQQCSGCRQVALTIHQSALVSIQKRIKPCGGIATKQVAKVKFKCHVLPLSGL
jgi:hypothetical protein